MFKFVVVLIEYEDEFFMLVNKRILVEILFLIKKLVMLVVLDLVVLVVLNVV